MKSLRRKLSHSMRRSRSSIVDESISELGENGIEDDPGIVNKGLSCGCDNDVRQPGLDDVTASVVMRNHFARKRATKRLSLPAHLQLPPSFLQQNPTPGEIPMSRRLRRASMSEIGFGKLESYVKLNKLGEGTYAKVFKGKSKLTNELVALKEIRLEHEEGAPCTAIREASLLKDLKQANIVTLHDIIHTKRNLILVFEYLDRDLKQYMNLHDNILSMNNVKALQWYQVIGSTVPDLTDLRVELRFFAAKTRTSDLKPQNLLINDRGELKLADFGLARAKSVPTKTYSNEVVTLWYRPPDVLLGSTEYNASIDIWGIGCIFYEMVTGQPLFPGSTVNDQLALIFKTLGTPTEETWKGVSRLPSYRSHSGRIYPGESMRVIAPRLEYDGIDMISKLLEYNPNDRMSAADGQRHHFFNCFGPNIHKLPDTTSIFTLTDIKMTKNPSNRLYEKGRRQSMLF